MAGLDLPRAVSRQFALREAGSEGWRLVETTLTEDAFLSELERLGIAAVEVRFVMECLTKSPPEGVAEVEGGSIWTGTAHDWVYDESAQCWRAPDEPLLIAKGEPVDVDKVDFELGYPSIGWMPVTITAGGQVAAFEASTVFDPFDQLTAWLEAIAAGRSARQLINIEGVNMGLHVLEPQGDTVRFVVTNDSEDDLVIELDVRIARDALIRSIYLPFLEFWEGDALAAGWRREWRYDDDDDADASSITNKPYVVRSTLLDTYLQAER